MSKFFKWLKKDKQQQESPVVDKASLKAADEQVSLEPELIKNNSSFSNASTIETNEKTQSEQAKTPSDSKPKTIDYKGLETDSSTIENNHSYTNTTSKNSLKKSDHLIETESKSKAPVSGAIIENTSISKNTSPLENVTIVENTSPLENTLLRADNEPTTKVSDKPSAEQQDAEKIGFLSKLKRGLSRTKESIGSGIVSLFRGKAINDELFEELETQLLVADVGMNTTIKIIKQLTESSNRKQLKDGDALYQLLKETPHYNINIFFFLLNIITK
jgi:fused signal recognition particle receptor